MRRALLLAGLLASCGSEPASTKTEATTCDDRSLLTRAGCVTIGPTDCIACAAAVACGRGTFAPPGSTECAAPTTIALDGTIVYVSAAAAASGDGTAARPFRTIQAAVAAAPLDARIAIAPGEYRENISITRSVMLIGESASKVSIVGTVAGRPAVDVRAPATIAGVAITGNDIGVSVRDTSATLNNVWVHDTGVVGVNVDIATGDASVRIEASLIELASYAGVASFGAEVEIVSSAIRDTRFLGKKGGPGVLGAFFKFKRPKLTVRDSVLERNREVGVGVAGGDLIVDHCIVTNTESMDDGTAGNGILASRDKSTGVLPTLSVRRTYVGASREVGIAINGGSGTIEQTIVADTRLRAWDNFYGVGIQADPEATLAIRNVLVSGSRHMGIAYFGAKGTIDDTIVEDTILDGDNKSAVGIAIVEVDGRRANVTATRTLANRNLVAGFMVGASDATLIDCSVRNTMPRADGVFGDGVVGLASDSEHQPNLTIDGLTAIKNARAGVTLFGGSALIRRSRLACNAFDLNAEAYPAPPSLKDDGENVCGCANTTPCRASSNTLLVQVSPIREGR